MRSPDDAAADVPESLRRLVVAVPDANALGLLVLLDEEGPLPAPTLLDASDRCESDVHGLFAELRAAGVVTEQTIAGERGYDLTDAGERAVRRLRTEN